MDKELKIKTEIVDSNTIKKITTIPAFTVPERVEESFIKKDYLLEKKENLESSVNNIKNEIEQFIKSRTEVANTWQKEIDQINEDLKDFPEVQVEPIE